MLIQFAVENFRSFKEKAVLSMVASGEEGHPEHVYTLPDGLRVLRCALIYGANASGKSNLVLALTHALGLITEGVRPGKQIPLHPFRLDPSLASSSSRFEFEVSIEGRRYAYGLVVSAVQVESEWLYVTSDGQEQMWFERALNPERPGKAEIQLGGVFGEQRQRVEFVAQGTRAEQLFLTEAEERDVPHIKPLMEWFRQQIRCIVAPNAPYPKLALEAEKDEGFRLFLAEVLRSAGTGISGLQVKTEAIKHIIQETLSDEWRSVLAPGFRAMEQELHEKGGAVRSRKKDGGVELTRLLARHDLPGGGTVEFEISDESDGTRRLLHLAPALYLLRQGTVPVFVIDELDRSLHPLLTRMYLEKFLSLDKAGQLICTTHDTNLLHLSLLRPDEIWFTEKDAAQGSHLYSLAEFKRDQLDRLGDNLEQGYLNGRFGAIPFFGGPAQLGLKRAGG